MSMFTGVTFDLGIDLVDIFAGAQILVTQFWPIIALGIAIPLGFRVAGRLIRLGNR